MSDGWYGDSSGTLGSRRDPSEAGEFVRESSIGPSGYVDFEGLTQLGFEGGPVFLFVATCLTTYMTGGLAFAIALMVTLLAHELGHYLQARRYGVPASLPFFIPMPASPIGTMGAVIVMQPGMGNRRTGLG